MVLILSEEQDESTNEVIDWLIHNGRSYLRINHEDDWTVKGISINSLGVQEAIITNGKGEDVDLSTVDSYWYRRGSISKSLPDLRQLQDQATRKALFEHLFDEWSAVKEFYHGEIEELHGMGSSATAENNKLKSLKNASAAGLNIPETIITSSKDELLKFMEGREFVVTKSIHEGLSLIHEGHYYGQFTAELNLHRANQLSNTFYPSLFQEKLKKRFEIRVFVMGERIYAMAIFSQMDEGTKVDFRHYNDERPNRTVPFDLPDNLCDQLKSYMNLEGLDTGSIDLVYTEDDEYVFLEVNPVGQFGMVSYPCNYRIEKDIAELIATT